MRNVLVSLRLLLVLPLHGLCAEPALFSDLLAGEYTCFVDDRTPTPYYRCYMYGGNRDGGEVFLVRSVDLDARSEVVYEVYLGADLVHDEPRPRYWMDRGGLYRDQRSVAGFFTVLPQAVPATALPGSSVRLAPTRPQIHLVNDFDLHLDEYWRRSKSLTRWI